MFLQLEDMFWLTKRLSGQWYVVVTCKRCKSRTVVMRDESNSKGDFHMVYFFSCPNCHHQANHEAERYWHPSEGGKSVD